MTPKQTRDERLLETYITVRVAAEQLGVTPEAIVDRIRRKTLPAVVIARRRNGQPRLYLIPRAAILEPRRRPGRPRKATGQRYVPEREIAASPDDIDFLEEALRELPDAVASGGGTDAADTRKFLDSRRPGDAPEDGEA